MKLWQKIFVSTLFLVILAIDIIAVLLLSNNHRLTIERERQRVLSEHNYLSSALSDYVLYTRLRQNKILLNEKETLEAIKSALDTDGTIKNVELSLYADNEQLISSSQCSKDTERALLEQINEQQQVSQITKQQDKTYMLAASTLKIEGRQYKLVTASDVSAIYQLRYEQIEYVKTMSIVCGLVIAGVLLVIVWLLMLPLHRVNTGMRRIANGNYSKRLKVRGHGEIAELANTMNNMADAVEKNIDSLEQVAEERKTFIANLAHEMKTPLTSILGFADILRIKRVVTDKERQEYANIIVDETKRLRSLSSKLMELITVGSTKLDYQKVLLHDLLYDVYMALQPVLDNHKITLYWDAPEDVMIEVDLELFKSLLYNLVDNSVKASQPGQEIYMVAGYKKDRLFISVKDEGMGIPEKEIKRITQPFYMVDKARTRKAGGAGLGLALCLEIARLHHAQLLIDSKLGKGTIMTVLFSNERGEG